MKLFIKDDCEHCNQIDLKKINVEVINIDKDYNGLLPHQVPVLQMSSGGQVWDFNSINSIFDELRKAKK